MGKHHWHSRYRPGSEAAFDEKCRILAGRAGVIAGVLVFIATYIYGIAAYGVLLGIALGWLASGAIAWLTAILVSSAGIQLAKRMLRASWRLSQAHMIKPGVQHK